MDEKKQVDKRLCLVDGCKNPVKARGLCANHHSGLRNGTIFPDGTPVPPEQRAGQRAAWALEMKSRRTVQSKPTSVRSGDPGDLVLLIGDYPELLSKLKAQAKKDFRPVELEALWIISSWLQTNMEA